MRILIVDDEEPIVDLLATVCAGEGHETACCTTSTEALEYLAKNRVDLLITDIAMPPPDGLQLVKEARQLQPHILAIVITGYAARYPLEEVLAAGASDLMLKPFRMEEMKARIALADRRRQVVEDLNNRRRQLQEMTADMIKDLEHELEEARRPHADAGYPRASGQ